MNERDGAAPVPLPRDSPVAQPVLHPLLAEAPLLEARGDRIHRRLELEPGELSRIHRNAIFTIARGPDRGVEPTSPEAIDLGFQECDSLLTGRDIDFIALLLDAALDRINVVLVRPRKDYRIDRQIVF